MDKLEALKIAKLEGKKVRVKGTSGIFIFWHPKKKKFMETILIKLDKSITDVHWGMNSGINEKWEVIPDDTE